jgi:hypothetical protein
VTSYGGAKYRETILTDKDICAADSYSAARSDMGVGRAHLRKAASALDTRVSRRWMNTVSTRDSFAGNSCTATRRSRHTDPIRLFGSKVMPSPALTAP